MAINSTLYNPDETYECSGDTIEEILPSPNCQLYIKAPVDVFKNGIVSFIQITVSTVNDGIGNGSTLIINESEFEQLVFGSTYV